MPNAFQSRCRNQYKKDVPVGVAQYFCVVNENRVQCKGKYSTEHSTTDARKSIGFPNERKREVSPISDSVRCMHVQVQKKRLVKNQCNSG